MVLGNETFLFITIYNKQHVIMIIKEIKRGI